MNDPRQINISNEFWGLVFNCELNISNLGKGPLNVGDMRMYVTLDKGKPNQSRILIGRKYIPFDKTEIRSLGYFTVKPGESWSGSVYLSEELTEEQEVKRSLLYEEIFEQIQKSYLNDKSKINAGRRLVYEASDKELKSVNEFMEEHVSWLERGNYKILLFIKKASNSHKFILRKGYRFTLNEAQLKGIKLLQPQSYKYPAMVPDNLFFTYKATPTIQELPIEESSNLIKEYEQIMK